MIKKSYLKSGLIVFFSGAFLAFGLYQVHATAHVTEGGVLGATLLLEHWFSLSPALSGLLLNFGCYILGWKLMGKDFVLYSVLSTVGFSFSYKIWELFPPLWPGIAEHPLLAAILGAVFVGLGAGICVRFGGAPSGDDALAMSISYMLRVKIQWVYLIFDLLVLGLSLSYIPLRNIIYSLLTVVLSGQLIGLVQKVRFPHRRAHREDPKLGS